jgi:flagellar hook-associated protein 3 FlgL
MLGKYNEATQKTDGVVTSANDISYKQINDIVAMVAAGNMPEDDISNAFNANMNRLYNLAANVVPPNVINENIAKRELAAGINDQAVVDIINNAVDEAFAGAGGANITDTLSKIKDVVINHTDYATGRFEAYNKAVDAASASVNVELNYRGQMQITDKSSTATNIEVTIFEEFENGEFSKDKDGSMRGSLFNFTANNMISIDEPSVDIFKDLDAMIAAVRDGSYRGNPDGTNARTTGIQGALKRIDHIQDHVNKLHTQIGSYTNVLESSNSRASMLYVNVESIKNDVIGADLGESMLIYKQYLTQFEAMLQTSSMISKISLLNYM